MHVVEKKELATKRYTLNQASRKSDNSNCIKTHGR